MTELSDRMIERLEDEFGASVWVGPRSGEIEFCSGYGEDVVLHFNPDNAVEDIIDQAENFSEDEHVLMWTTPQGDPSSLHSDLSSIRGAAEDYLNDLDDAFTQIKNWRAAGWSDKDIKDGIDNGYLRSHNEQAFGIDMENGEICFNHPALYRDLGTGEEMTVDEVMDAIQDERSSHDVDDVICEEIGVDGTALGAPSISDLIEDSQGIHQTLDFMSNMLQEQRDIEQQETR